MLPASPNRTYGTDTAVHPGDLDDIQDCIVAAKHGDVKLMIPGSAGVANSNVTREFSGYGASIESTGATTITYPLALRVGDRIKSVKVTVLGNASADITALDIIRIHGLAGAGAYSSASLFTVVPAANTPAALTEITCDLADYTVVAGDAIFVGLVINATGLKVYRLEITYDRP